MKKIQILFYLILSMAIISSCEKTEDDDDDDDTFSELTVEQNKQHLEDDGLEMLDKMKDMESSAAIDVAAAMVHFMDLADPFEGNPNIGKKSAIMSTLKPLIAVSQMRELGYNVAFHALKSVQEDPQSIQEAYDMASGIYTWNNATQVWGYTDSGTEIVFQFPSTKTGTSNNAEAKVYGYEGYTGTIGYDVEDYEGDLPENIDISLKADNNTLFTFNFSASYTNEGEPTSVSTSMTLDSFSMLVSASNSNNQKAEFLYEFKDGSEILTKVVLGAEGNWSADNIDNNTVIEYDTVYYEEWNPETGEWEETDEIMYIEEYMEINGEKIVFLGNVEFRVMNTKVVGEAKIKELIEGEKEIYAAEDAVNFDDDAATLAMVDLINLNVDMKIRYTDNNEIIAVAEAYAYDDTYYDYIWNPSTFEYEEVLMTEKEIGMRFKFGDGSTTDAEIYFEEGFEDLQEQFEAWIDQLEDEWDL